MKIAMIGLKGVSSRAGGIEIHVEELGSRLVKCGHDIYVYTRPHFTDKNLTQYMGMNLICRPSINTKSLDAISHTFISTFDCLFKDFDIIHFHALGPSSLSFIPKLFNKKVVCTVHGLDWKREKWGKLAKSYLKLGEKATATFPDRTIVVSQTLQKYYYETYGRKTYYIPNGVNIPCIVEPDIIRTKYALEKKDYFLFLARLVPEKGAHHLIKAYNLLNTDKKLVIAGGSNYTYEYENYLKELAGNNKNIIFTGHVTGFELCELFSNAFLYILPSEIEGLPISLLEAMSYGQCPVVSDISENLEVIEDCGFSFKSGNYENLYRILYYLLKNPNLIETKAALSTQKILSNYNWDIVSAKTMKVYYETLKNS